MVSFIVFFAAAFAAASSGGIFKPGDWYRGLRKPKWTPPNWMFPVVWTCLFTSMAVASWLVWKEAGTNAALPLALYGIHLVVNALWSYLFFGLKRLDYALVNVLGLWLMIIAVIVAFSTISPTAARLLSPYLVWVTIATALNLRLLQLNGRKGDLSFAKAD